MDNATPIEAISLNFYSDNKSALGKIDEVINKLSQLQARVSGVKLSVNVKGIKSLAESVNNISEDGVNKISRLAEALERLSNVTVNSDVAGFVAKLNKAMNVTGTQGVERAAEALQNLNKITDSGDFTKGATMTRDIAEPVEKLTEIAPPVRDLAEYLSNSSQAAYQLSSGIATITENLIEMSSASNQVAGLLPANRMGGLLPAVSSAGRMRSDAASEAMNSHSFAQQFATMTSEVIKGRMAVYQLNKSIEDTANRGQRLKAVFSGLGNFFGNFKGFFSTGKGMLADAFSGKGGLTGMTPFGSALGTGLKTIGKGMLTPFIKELQLVGKSALGAGARLGSFFGSIKRIATYRLIRAALKLITQGFKEGVTNLYEWSKAFDKTHEFAKSLDKIATAALYVKNSLGAMVAPIINALAPALDWLADKFVGLLNIINEFFAALTGADTYTVAKKVATEFKEAADSTGKATKALKSFTIGIDELNIIEESGSSGSGGGGGSNVAQDWFEKKEVDKKVSDFTKRIKKMFEDEDWEGIGRLIGTKINEGIEKIPWAKIGSTAGKIFTAAFSIGTAILDTIDFVNFGSKVATMVNNFFEQADFSKAGEFFVTSFFSGVDFIGGFLGTLKWGTVTSKISDFFIGGMRKAKKWFESKNWKEVGSKLYNNIKDALNGLKLTDLISSAWELLRGVTSATIDVVVSFVGSWGEDIGNWFYDLSNGQLPDAGTQPLQFIIGGVGADIIEGLVYLAKNGYIDENLNITVKSIDQGLYNIGEKTTPLAPGLLMSPDPGGSSLGGDMWKNFLDVIEKIKTTLADIIELLAKPFGDNPTEQWGNIKDAAKAFGDKLGDVWDLLQRIRNFDSDAMCMDFEKISRVGENKFGVLGVVIDDVKDRFKDLKEKGGEYATNIGIAFGTIPTAIAKHWTTLSGKLRYIKAKIELESLKLWNAIKSAFKLKVNQFITILNSAIRGIYKALNKVSKSIDKMAESGTFGMIGAGLISKIGGTFATAPQIPQLARGGVIDPNKPFLALLGDQKNGKNIEAPLETIKKALEDVIRDYDAESISMPGMADVVNEVRRYADNKISSKSDTESMQRFYEDTVMPVITAIANDARRQADKEEKTEIIMDGRKVTDTVNKQNRANGYSFIR